MQRDQVLAAVVAAAALLSFGLAADGLASDPPPVGREFEDPEEANPGYEPPQVDELWNPPDCEACSDAEPLVGRAADSLPPTALAGLAVLALGAIGGLLVLTDRGDDDGLDAADETGDSLSTDARVAADRPDPGPIDVDPDNGVYEAWLSMAERVDGATSRELTPGEYAARARDAGLDAGAVETLTRLFRRVRYGGAQVTPDLEREAARARDALDGADSRDRDDADAAGGSAP